MINKGKQIEHNIFILRWQYMYLLMSMLYIGFYFLFKCVMGYLAVYLQMLREKH